MSGIYILVTKNSYRVTYSKNYESFLADWNEVDYGYELNGNIVEKEFDKSPIFLDETSAYQYALELANKYPETDDGIYYIKNAKDKSYEEIING